VSPATDGHLFEPDDNLFTRVEAAKSASTHTPTTLNFSQGDVAAILELFENAKTFGSLIQVPPKLAAKLPEIEKRLDDVLKFGDLTHASAHVLNPLLQQARLLGSQYETVVANPPYMGNRYLPPALKRHLVENYSGYDNDLFSAFSMRLCGLGDERSTIGVMTPMTWMFITTHELLRTTILADHTLSTLVQLEYSGFAEATVPICTFTCTKRHIPGYTGTFIRLSDFRGADIQGPKTREAISDTRCYYRYHSKPDSFRSIPGSPIGYWTSSAFRDAFQNCTFLKDIAEPRVGLQTGDNNHFLRLWHEVDVLAIGFGFSNRESASKSDKTWFPYNKGGDFRKWYGNNDYVVKWRNGGSELEAFKPRSVLRNPSYYFRPSITWSFVSSSFFGVRRSDQGFLFDIGGSSAFPSDDLRNLITGFMCSRVVFEFMKVLNPTLNFQVGNVASLPLRFDSLLEHKKAVDNFVECAVSMAREDWDSHERSWDFMQSPLLTTINAVTVEECYRAWECLAIKRRRDMASLEEANNDVFINAYNLQDDYTSEVPDDQITLCRPDREEDIKRLLSYAIGCMMGRYSLDKPGLIYAHSSNEGYDHSQYTTFRADDDGIIPLLETDWGIRDDATNRFVEFIGVAWPKEHLEENLKFVAASIGSNTGEQPRETIRRYLAASGAGGFYKHHLSMYKKRPIYWLFSSGKQRAFQCLVYLHRYHEGTLARMRTEYVIPLQGQIAGRIEQLEGDKLKATSTSHRKKLQKEQDDLKKQQTELLTFEEKLKHAADQKISLDLDDGVKVNYAKFGDLLAESKAICGTKEED